jgi:hypothetical protein
MEWERHVERGPESEPVGRSRRPAAAVAPVEPVTERRPQAGATTPLLSPVFAVGATSEGRIRRNEAVGLSRPPAVAPRRLISRSGEAATIRRMTITDYPKGKGKTRVDGYTSADSKRFKQTYLNVTLGKKIAKPEKITAKDLDEFYTSVLPATNLTQRDDFDLLFSRVADSSASFANVGAFLAELDRLADEWENQRFFFDSDKVPGPLKDPRDDQPAARLYGAKRLVDARKIYYWAEQKGVTTDLPDGLLGDPLPDASIMTEGYTGMPKGHWADRVHTMSYDAQQGETDRLLVTLELTTKASNALVKVKKADIKGGGEGKPIGGFSFKHEGGFVSVNLAAGMWDGFKPNIETIRFSASP